MGMKSLQRQELGRASRVRDARMHRGRKSVTTQEWIHKGDDKNGTPRIYTAEQVKEEEWKRWISGVKPPKVQERSVDGAYKRPESEGERMTLAEAGVYVKCTRGWDARKPCGGCKGREFYKSCG